MLLDVLCKSYLFIMLYFLRNFYVKGLKSQKDMTTANSHLSMYNSDCASGARFVVTVDIRLMRHVQNERTFEINFLLSSSDVLPVSTVSTWLISNILVGCAAPFAL